MNDWTGGDSVDGMDDWVQAIYDATGIPLNDGDLRLAFLEGQWMLLLHRYPVIPAGDALDPWTAVTPAIRGALARALKQRLLEHLPRMRELVEGLDSERASDIAIQVMNVDGATSPQLDGSGERGWPHYVVRLSTGTYDMEVDVNPYVPDDPIDLDEVQRQAAILLEVARTTPQPDGPTMINYGP